MTHVLRSAFYVLHFTRTYLAALLLLCALWYVPAFGAVNLAPVPAPRNPAANGPALLVEVSAAGLQQLGGAALLAAGLDPAGLDPDNLRLWHNGSEIALERRGLTDGRLDPDDELRFYAPEPGDRWNAAERYWLTIDQQAGRTMATRDLSPGDAPARDTALVRGRWRDNRLYDSTMAGPDGDHWFAADLRGGPGLPQASLTITLPNTLPLAGGPMTVTVAGAAYTPGLHNLEVHAGGASIGASWNGAGDWQQSFVLAAAHPVISLVQPQGSLPDGFQIDYVNFEQPVSLNGDQGFVFDGVAGRWRYQLSGPGAGQELYEISDPWQPAQIAGFDGTFEDGPQPGRYLLSGPATMHTPLLQSYQPLPLPTPAEVLFIAPASLHGALTPLIEQRRAQGYNVGLVDVQQLYDHWSFGRIDPAAIRDFLRYAAATWPAAPHAVTLVGDGTSDPRNFTGRNNQTLIPPYLAAVDPWLIETACESCYARLDSDDPLDDPLPDLWLGRLPVKNAEELARLVAKIISYENAQPGGLWRTRQVFLADNGYEADGTPDQGGDFGAMAEQAAALQPPGVERVRLYYDPWQRDRAGNPLNQPYREADAVQAGKRTMAAINAGAALVTYIGHSHHWQWAATDVDSGAGLLGLNDVDRLSNGEQLPIVLSMTCLSGSFHQPAYSGTSLDERLLLHTNGGAVAVWGPTGLGVAYGHEALQRGFMRALWEAAPAAPPLGQLVQAGYAELYRPGGCCQSTLYTFALLGDPLTPVRVARGWQNNLPLIRTAGN